MHTRDRSRSPATPRLPCTVPFRPRPSAAPKNPALVSIRPYHAIATDRIVGATRSILATSKKRACTAFVAVAKSVARHAGSPPMKLPRPAGAASGSMAGMGEQHLREALERVHIELQGADTIDDRSRELLRSVLGDIEDLLERKQKRGT